MSDTTIILHYDTNLSTFSTNNSHFIETGVNSTSSSDNALRSFLSILGFLFGLEAIAINLFALYLFFTLPNCKNVHGRLCIVKTAADLPYAFALTFWWLPWSAFYEQTTEFTGLHGSFLLLDLVIVTITFTSYYFALHVEVLIVLARFTAVFYTFTFRIIFCQTFLTIILILSVILGIAPVGKKVV